MNDKSVVTPLLPVRIACQQICLEIRQLKDLYKSKVLCKYFTCSIFITRCLLLQRLNIVLFKSTFLWTATKSFDVFSSLSSCFTIISIHSLLSDISPGRAASLETLVWTRCTYILLLLTSYLTFKEKN